MVLVSLSKRIVPKVTMCAVCWTLQLAAHCLRLAAPFVPQDGRSSIVVITRKEIRLNREQQGRRKDEQVEYQMLGTQEVALIKY